MADSSSDLTALIARADRTLLIMENVVTEPLPLEVSDLLKAMTGLVRDLRDALAAAEARCRAVEQERDKARWFESVTVNEWQKRAEAAEQRVRELQALADAGREVSFPSLCDGIDSKHLEDSVYGLVMFHIRQREAAEQALAALRGTGPR